MNQCKNCNQYSSATVTCPVCGVHYRQPFTIEEERAVYQAEIAELREKLAKCREYHQYQIDWANNRLEVNCYETLTKLHRQSKEACGL